MSAVKLSMNSSFAGAKWSTVPCRFVEMVTGVEMRAAAIAAGCSAGA